MGGERQRLPKPQGGALWELCQPRMSPVRRAGFPARPGAQSSLSSELWRVRPRVGEKFSLVTAGSELSLVAGRHGPEHKAQRPAPGLAVGPRPSAHCLAQKIFLVITLRHSMARAVPVQNHQRKHFSSKINLGTSLLSCTKETLTNSLKTPILCATAFQGLFKLSTNFSKACFLMVIPGFKHLFPQFCVVVISHFITHRCMRTPNSGSAHPKPNQTQFYCAATSYKDSAGGRGLKAQSRAAPQGLLLLSGAQLPPLQLGKLCHFIPLWPQAPATYCPGPFPPGPAILQDIPLLLCLSAGGFSFPE